MTTRSTYALPEELRPSWLSYPKAHCRLVGLGLVNFEPWYLLEGDHLKSRYAGLQERYPTRHLVPFAQRSDSDDVACWDRAYPDKVVIVHDYASREWEQRGVPMDFWDWFRKAIEDMIFFDS
jgi:hypothetical protein